MFRTQHFLTLVVAFSSIALLTRELISADHRDAPLVLTDGSADINDVYAFQSPVNPANVVFIMTVNPFAGELSGTAFNTRAVYEIDIDASGDAVPDFAYRFYFSTVRRGVQRLIVIDNNGRPVASGQTGSVAPVSGGGSVTAGVFDDPFFFDSNGFNNGFQFTGSDFFAGKNVSAIVIEVPSSTFGNNNISVATRTVVGGRQFDRNGRPAINTVLIPPALKNAFNASLPVNDPVNFSGTVQARLVALGNSPQRASDLTSILLPDVLTVDTSSALGFLNGRRLSDDVIDAELNLLSNGAVTGDGVNSNDKPFQSVFPYLAAPHQ